MPRDQAARRPSSSRKPIQKLDRAAVRTNQMVADFMKVSSDVERYLQQKKPLTDLQHESIVTTIHGLETMLATWRTHFGIKKVCDASNRATHRVEYIAGKNQRTYHSDREVTE